MKSRKVYKYIFWFAVEGCLLNGYLFYRYTAQTGKVIHTYKDYRVELAKQLIGAYNRRKRHGRPLQQVPPPCEKRPTLAHFPKKHTKGRCAYCQRNRRRRETTWFCTGCNVCLCHTGDEASDCFASYHVFCGLYDAQ